MPLRNIFLAGMVLIATAAAQTSASGTQAVQAALRAGDLAHALVLSTAQLKQTPRDPKLWTLQGIALTGLHKEKEALSAYNQALAIAPEYLPALEGAAQLEYQAESARAVPLLNRILKQQPDDPTSHAM